MALDKELKRIEREFNTLKRKLPKLVGQIAVNFTKDNFRKQGFLNGGNVKKWKKRGSFDKNKKKRNILTDSGRMKRSVSIIRASRTQVVIGTRGIIYSEIHNQGGTIRQTVTNKQRAFFWAKFKVTKNEIWKGMALATKIEIKIPKRKFIGASSDLDKQIEKKIILELKKIFK